MATNKKKRVKCAGTVTFRVNESGGIEFLLVLPRKGNGQTYGVPKGHCEDGESVEETAVRETYEETGAVARLLYELPPVFTATPKEIKTVHLFLASQINNSLCPQQKEVREVEWFPIDQLPPIHDYQQSAIQHAINTIRRNL